jgi:hypothetical protein
MSGLDILGLVLLVYGAFVLYLVFSKPTKLWELVTKQAILRSMNARGRTIFIWIWGAIAAGLGIFFLLR